MNLFDKQVGRYVAAITALKTGTQEEQVHAAARMESITNIVVNAGIDFDAFLGAVDRRLAEEAS